MKVVTKELSATAAAAQYGYSRQHLQRLLARYEQGGLDAVEPRSRRPRTNPQATPQMVRDRIIALRVQLSAQGLDAGPVTISWHLEQEGHRAPSTSTIRRILHAAQLEVPRLRKLVEILEAVLPEAGLAAEIADGVIGHPMWSIDWTIEHMAPAYLDELRKHGRERKDVCVSIWPWVAINDNKAEAIADARSTVAYYASAVQYESFFEMNGFGAEARACQAGIEANKDISSFNHHVSDEMVETFVATGSMKEVAAKLEPLWSVANHLCPAPPMWNLAPATVQSYLERIGAFVATESGATGA